MKAAQLLLAASVSRRTHPRHWAGTFQKLKGARSATESSTNNLIGTENKRHYEWSAHSSGKSRRSAASCRARPKWWQHAQGVEQLRNQGRRVVQRGRDVCARASDARAHHHQPEL